jgi:2-methylcitrate dehydratase PrpD
MEGPDAAVYWQDLGKHWLITEQYFKPYPVCRWAQAPIEAVLALKTEHGLTSDMVKRIEITSFHESIRLATNTPRTTEEAQYSTSFPCAVALVKGTLGPEDVAEAALSNPEIMRLSQGLVMREDDYCNRHFPQQRYAKATLVLKDGRIVTSDFFSPRWTAEEPPSRDELCTKYHDLADKRVGCERAEAIEAAVFGLGVGGGVGGLLGLIRAPLG